MTEQTRRRLLLIVAGLFIANFLVSFVLWLAGQETSGDVIVRGLIALLMTLATRKLSRRVKLAMWIVVGIAIANLVWHWSVQ